MATSNTMEDLSELRPLAADSELVVSLVRDFRLVEKLRPMQERIILHEQAQLREDLQKMGLSHANVEETVRKDAEAKRVAFHAEAAEFARFLLRCADDGQEWQVRSLLCGDYDVKGDGRALIKLFTKWRWKRRWFTIAKGFLDVERDALDVWRHRATKRQPKLSKRLAEALGVTPINTPISTSNPQKARLGSKGRYRLHIIAALSLGVPITGLSAAILWEIGQFGRHPTRLPSQPVSHQPDPGKAEATVGPKTRALPGEALPEESPAVDATQEVGRATSQDGEPAHAASARAVGSAAVLADWYKWPQATHTTFGGSSGLGFDNLALDPDGTLHVRSWDPKRPCKGVASRDIVLVECRGHELDVVYLGWREQLGDSRRLSGDAWTLDGNRMTALTAWALYDPLSKAYQEDVRSVSGVPYWYIYNDGSPTEDYERICSDHLDAECCRGIGLWQFPGPRRKGARAPHERRSTRPRTAE